MTQQFPRAAAVAAAPQSKKHSKAVVAEIICNSSSPVSKTEAVAAEGSAGHENTEAGSNQAPAKDQDEKTKQTLQHTMVASAVALARESNIQAANIIFGVAAPLRQEHSDDSRRLTGGPIATQLLYSEWAIGAWHGTLYKIAQTSSDATVLAEAGMKLELQTSKQEEICPDDILVEEQDELAVLFDRFQFQLLRRRVQSMSEHSEAAPGILAGLVHPCEDETQLKY